MDARIIKVASGGLDESFLWENVADGRTVRRIERAMERFGMNADGALIGEGGEFETLVIDGPGCLFKERIEVGDGKWRVVREGGGTAWLSVGEARTVVKNEESGELECRVPDLFDARFEDILDVLRKEELRDGVETSSDQSIQPYYFPSVVEVRQGDVLYWTITAKDHTNQGISDEAGGIITELQRRLSRESLQSSDITSSTIILRSMDDFQTVNQIYGPVFTHPNPPSRVTISCGPAMPVDINIILHLKISLPSLPRRGLHVQSRSYWAPANIGPYSQAISTNHSSSSQESPWTVHIAGQIPLIPSSMQLPSPSSTAQATFSTQTVLSLQHLSRIASETQTQYFTSTVAYLPHSSPLPISTRAIIAGRAWILAHAPLESGDDDDEDSAPDLWEAKHNYQNHQNQYLSSSNGNDSVFHSGTPPPFFAVEVESLPRGAGVEWHAHVGITGSSSQVDSEEGPGWRMDHCRTAAGRIYSVFRLFWDARMRGLGDVVGKEGIYGSYVDVSGESDVMGKMGRENGINMAGMVPCRSIWDGDGRRIAVVLLFDRVI
jgi:diphthine-ammonia ligase